MNGNEKKLNPGDRVRIIDDMAPEEVAGQEVEIIARLWELSDGTTGYITTISHPQYRELFFFGDQLTLLAEESD